MIPKGYQMHIESWENDADAYKTSIISGLTKEDVCYFTTLSKRFYRNYEDKSSDICNDKISDELLRSVLLECQESHPHVSEFIKEDFFITNEALSLKDFPLHQLMHDFYYFNLCELVLGYPVHEIYRSMGMFCRVVSDIKVFYYPIDIDEVTHLFVE